MRAVAASIVSHSCWVKNFGDSPCTLRAITGQSVFATIISLPDVRGCAGQCPARRVYCLPLAWRSAICSQARQATAMIVSVGLTPSAVGKHEPSTTSSPGTSWASYHSRSEEHTYELQSLMSSSYVVFCSKQKTTKPQK